jgi:hypothetical protein
MSVIGICEASSTSVTIRKALAIGRDDVLTTCGTGLQRPAWHADREQRRRRAWLERLAVRRDLNRDRHQPIVETDEVELFREWLDVDLILPAVVGLECQPLPVRRHAGSPFPESCVRQNDWRSRPGQWHCPDAQASPRLTFELNASSHEKRVPHPGTPLVGRARGQCGQAQHVGPRGRLHGLVARKAQRG